MEGDISKMINRKVHFLKLDSKYIEAIENGTKSFEIRKNDRNFKTGDIIIFTDANGKVIFSYFWHTITYILADVPRYGLKKGYC